MDQKIKKQAEKMLAKEINKAVRNYKPEERQFPIEEEPIRYTLSDNELANYEIPYTPKGTLFICGDYFPNLNMSNIATEISSEAITE